ncbi:MAG: ATP-binding protein [Pseudomonadota bacterium]
MSQQSGAPRLGSSNRLVCVSGPECSGKTTLAKDLANALGAPYLPELARCWLEVDSSRTQNEQLIRDLVESQEQEERHRLEAVPSGWIIADTDVVVLAIWWLERFAAADQSLPSWLGEVLDRRTPRRYLLATPEMPWLYDPLRSNPNDRDRLLERHIAWHEQDRFPWILLHGSHAERRATALALLTVAS